MVTMFSIMCNTEQKTYVKSSESLVF